MKIRLLFITLALFAAHLVRGGSLTLIQPNGGELCLGQKNYPVKWTAVNISAKIKLVLFRNDEFVQIIAENLDTGCSPYLWTVGQHIGGTAPAGGGYKIRIRTMNNSTDDFSDAPFWLKTESPPCPPPLPPPPPPIMLKLDTPNGGENFILHHECTIAWESIAPAAVGKVQLQLVRYNDRTLGTIQDDLPATGSFSWKAGEYPGNTAPAGKYLIRVRSMADYKIFDESDSFFNLGPKLPELVGKLKAIRKSSVTLPGIYQNYSGKDTFPANVTGIPYSVFTEAFKKFASSLCTSGGANQTAMVGIYWFPYMNVQAAVIYRSRVHFALNEFAGKSAQLLSAKLKMKRVHSVHEDSGSGCGCSENIFVLQAPMAAFAYPGIGQRIDVPLGATEFSSDVTAIVTKWLDGTMANNGLLLLAGELPCSGGRVCFSCYEASLILTMK